MPDLQKPKKLFISHSHLEPDVAMAFDNLVTTAIEGLTDSDVRRTSSPDSGVLPGSYITSELINDIRSGIAFVALMSEAYLNSHYCLMEYAAWLGANEFPPMPLRFPEVEAEDTPGMISGALLFELTSEEHLRAVLRHIADRGADAKWVLRDEKRFRPQMETLLKVAKSPRPQRCMAQRFIKQYPEGDFLNAYGLKQRMRMDGVVQDFSINLDRDPIQFYWADSRTESLINAKWIKEEGLLRTTFFRAPGGYGCNFSIRPLNDQAAAKGSRSTLHILARVGPESDLNQIGVIVRLVNGYMQHWRLAKDEDNRKHLTVEGDAFREYSVDLEKEHWELFKMDGTGVRGPRGSTDFSVIASVNLTLGCARCNGIGDVGEGSGVLDVSRIWLE